jgi:hypothetical protein
VSSRDAATGDRTVDVRAFSIVMTKASGDWVIASAEGRPLD